MSDFDERLAEAIDLSDDGEYEQALVRLNALVTEFPTEPQAYFERAMTLLNLDRDAQAIPDLEKALALDPAYPGARDWLARALAGQGKLLLAAETKLQELRGKTEGNWAVSPQDWAECAGYFLKGGHPWRAREVLEAYFADYAGKVDAYKCYVTAPLRAYAEILVSLGEAETALVYAERAVAERDRVPADEFIWIRCLAETGQIDRASREFAARAEYAGTIGYKQTEAVLKSLSR
jgi:predicted Zn-dependent protease